MQVRNVGLFKGEFELCNFVAETTMTNGNTDRSIYYQNILFWMNEVDKEVVVGNFILTVEIKFLAWLNSTIKFSAFLRLYFY